ncbi:retrovirus-related pol polyprotein from transposon TNT 1-94, partial [Tanacetum coccineum]
VFQICLWCIDSGCSKHMTGNLKLLINFVWKFLGTVRFGNDRIATILDLDVAFRRNTCFVRNLEGVDLLKGNHTTNLYTINLYEIASSSPIFLMARATSTKSWLWHQRLSHLNFDTINDLAKNDLITGLPKFKYHKEHLCPSCEQGKSKKGISPTQTRFKFKAEVHFLISKDEEPEVIKTLLKKIKVLLQASVIIVRTNNGTEFKNQVLKNTLTVLASLTNLLLIYNRRTKKIMQTMNVTFDELSGLDLTYALSTITTQKPTERELDLLFEAMYDDYIGGEPSSAPRTAHVAPANQVLQTLTTSTTTANTTPTPTNSSSQSPTIPNTS